MKEAALWAEKSLYIQFFQFSCYIKKVNTFQTRYTSSHSLQFCFLWFFPLSCSLSCPAAAISSSPPFAFLLCFGSFWSAKQWEWATLPAQLTGKSKLKQHGTAQHIFLHNHRWMGVETMASKVRPACGDNHSICTEPSSSELSAHHISRAWLNAKANVHAGLCGFHFWNLTAICFLLGFLWDYKDLIMEPFPAWKKALFCFMFFTLVCHLRK